MNEKMSMMDIFVKLTNSFADAQAYIDFLHSDENNGEDWARINGVEIESNAAYDEAVERVKEDFRDMARIRIESEIKNELFDEYNACPSWLHDATREQIETIANKTYDEALEEIRRRG